MVWNNEILKCLIECKIQTMKIDLKVSFTFVYLWRFEGKGWQQLWALKIALHRLKIALCEIISISDIWISAKQIALLLSNV